MSKEHPDNPSSPKNDRAPNRPVSPSGDSARLASRIEELAAEMESSPLPARLDEKMLAQLDELRMLLREQRKELREQANDADEMLQQCHDELSRSGQDDLEKMRVQRNADLKRDRDDRRKRAA